MRREPARARHCRPTRRGAAVAATLVVLAIAAPRADAISFTPLSDLRGMNAFSKAYAVSADGTTVVGSSGPESLSLATAFVWDATQGMRGIGDLPGGLPHSIATEVSADGSVVVGLSHSARGEETFIWDSTNGMRDLSIPGEPDIETPNRPTGISADGTLISADVRRATGADSFVWRDMPQVLFLDDLPGGQVSTYASAVAGDGSVLVGTSIDATSPQITLWDPQDGSAQGLGKLPGDLYSDGVDVSSDGSVVVGISATVQVTEAVIWTEADGLVGIGHMPGSGDNLSIARAISGDGSTVVGWGRSATDVEAFVWDETHGMRSLRVILEAAGIDVTGWHLEEATDVSADGQTIVGFGTNPTGGMEGFVVVIPEPSPALLLALGLFATCTLAHPRAAR